METPVQVDFIRLRIDERTLSEAGLGLPGQDHPDLVSDSPRDVPVKAEHALESRRERPTPKGQPRFTVVQADVDHYAVGLPTDGKLDQRVDDQLRGDLPNGLVRVAVLKHGLPSNGGDSRSLEFQHERLVHAVHEVILLRIPREIRRR